MSLNPSIALVVGLALCAPALGAGPRPKLVVLELTAGGGVDAQVASALTEALTVEVAARGFFDVVSSKDLQTLLGLERQRQVMGCTDKGSSCLAELADAIGARFVLSGSVTQLGSAFQLNLQTLDTVLAAPLGRSTRIANGLGSLRSDIPFAAAEATATPLPPPPSRILPYSLIAAGGLAVIGGGVLGMQALAQEGAVSRELQNGDSNPAALRTLSSYREEVGAIEAQKTASVLLVAAGLAVAGVGIYLNPRDPTATGTTHLALVPAGRGAALVGIFP